MVDPGPDLVCVVGVLTCFHCSVQCTFFFTLWLAFYFGMRRGRHLPAWRRFYSHLPQPPSIPAPSLHPCCRPLPAMPTGLPTSQPLQATHLLPYHHFSKFVPILHLLAFPACAHPFSFCASLLSLLLLPFLSVPFTCSLHGILFTFSYFLFSFHLSLLFFVCFIWEWISCSLTTTHIPIP